MRSKLIVNLHAGRKAGIATNRARLKDVCRALGAHGIAPDIVETARPGHATELARAAVAESYDAVIGAGGDGTVREVAVGLLGSQVPLGIMPLGSVMNVARMLGVPRDVGQAAAVIAAGKAAWIDVGRAGGVYFLEAAGVGLDAALFRLANELDQRRWEALPRALRVALTYRPQRVVLELDRWSVELDAMMVTIANGPYCGAALHFAPEARIDDHLLDVRVYGPMSKPALLWTLLRPVSVEQATRVYTFKARDVRVTSPRPLPGHADSCPIGVTPLRFTLLPSALAVFVGQEVCRACGAPTPERDDVLARDVSGGLPVT